MWLLWPGEYRQKWRCASSEPAPDATAHLYYGSRVPQPKHNKSETGPKNQRHSQTRIIATAKTETSHRHKTATLSLSKRTEDPAYVEKVPAWFPLRSDMLMRKRKKLHPDWLKRPRPDWLEGLHPDWSEGVHPDRSILASNSGSSLAPFGARVLCFKSGLSMRRILASSLPRFVRGEA